MELKIIKLHKEAQIPEYAHSDDSGMDLCSIDEVMLKKGEIKLIKTGISIELPKNTEAQIRPRSGLALKHGITVLNAPGTIDEGYRGEIGIILINHSNEDFQIKAGMKVAQMVIMPVLKPIIKIVNELSETSRGNNGFGSTGL